jgi:hypothetical protein
MPVVDGWGGTFMVDRGGLIVVVGKVPERSFESAANLPRICGESAVASRDPDHRSDQDVSENGLRSGGANEILAKIMWDAIGSSFALVFPPAEGASPCS